MTAAIAAADLRKRYGRLLAVDGVSFEVASGEIVGFLGPNGAGKTTTMRMLCGLVRPTAGSATILGRPATGSNLELVGTMIEEPSFYPYLTGRANLRHAALLHGRVDSRRIDEVLEFVGMEHAARKKVAAYSQGMRQRLGLARALLWRPRVLILDEPTNGLDPVGIAEVRERLLDTAREGVAVLVSSHILAEIEKLVERVLVIEKGRLLHDGSLRTLLGRIDQKRVAYQLEAVDAEQLERVVRELGHLVEAVDAGRLRVWVPVAERARLISELGSRGVELLEARLEHDSLEGAYLRMLHDDGRPS